MNVKNWNGNRVAERRRKNLRTMLGCERFEDRALLSVALVDLGGASGPSALVSGLSASADGSIDTFAGQSGGQTEIFVHDATSGKTSLVSVAPDGTTPANASATGAVVSPDGRYVAFESAATNLTSIAPTNGGTALYVRDLSTGTTTLLDQTTAGQASNGNATASYGWSPVGDRLAFTDTSTNLTAATASSTQISSLQSVYVHDFSAGSTALVSSGEPSTASVALAFSPDGNQLAFTGPASATNASQELYVHDLNSGNTTLVSLNTAGAASMGNVADPVFSPDGKSIAFVSNATDLTNASAPAQVGANAYLTNLSGHVTTLLSQNTTGQLSDGTVSDLTFRGDGQAIAFTSTANDLVSNAASSTSPNVYVRDLLGNAIMPVSVATSGSLGDGASMHPVWSPDGQSIAFVSSADDLTSNLPDGSATNPPAQPLKSAASTNVYVRDLTYQDTSLVSATPAGNTAVGNVLGAPLFTSNSQNLSFVDSAGDLAANAPNGGLVSAGVPDGSISQIHFSASQYNAQESDRGVLITVVRDGPDSSPAVVRFGSVGGTASSGLDYAAAAGVLNFAPGQRTAVFGIPLNVYDPFPGTKTVQLVLTNPIGATLGNASATLNLTAGSAVTPPTPTPTPTPTTPTPVPPPTPTPTPVSTPTPPPPVVPPVANPTPAGQTTPIPIPVPTPAPTPIPQSPQPVPVVQPTQTPTNSTPAPTVPATSASAVVGPQALSVTPGIHGRRVTSLTIQFNEAIDPTAAQNTANYRLNYPDRLLYRRVQGLIHRPGRPIAIASATYNSASDSVTLALLRRSLLRAGGSFKLWINAEPGGIADLAGNALNSPGPGQPGTDVDATIGGQA